MNCKHCQHVEYVRNAPVLWCTKHQRHAIKPCEQFAREPGSDDEEVTQ